MYLVSDAQPDEKDVEKYRTVQKNSRMEILSKRRAHKLRRLQDNLVNNYTYTTEDIERNLEQRKKLGKNTGNLGSEQMKVLIAVQAARDALSEAERKLEEATLASASGDVIDADRIRDAEKHVSDCKKQLKAREEEEKRTRQVVDERKRRLKERSKDQNWAKVNKRALSKNQRADRDAHKEQEKDPVGGSGAAVKDVFNPYARRKVKPKILWEVGQDDEKKEEGKKDEAAMMIVDAKKDGDSAEKIKDVVMVEMPAAAATMEHEPNDKAATALSESHQFAIDEEALAKDSLSSLLLGSKRFNKKRVRKGISLAEYLERKAAGTL
jgi:RNA polymerase-associated protein RTF1